MRTDFRFDALRQFRTENGGDSEKLIRQYYPQ